MTASERFAMVPRSFSDELRRGDISSEEYALGAILIDEARGERLVIRTLVALRETLGWKCDSETVRRRVRRLETGGWLSCEVRPGVAAWTIRLTGLLRTSSPPPRGFLAGEPSDEEADLLTNSSHPESANSPEAASDAAQRDSAASSPVPPVAPRAPGDETTRDEQQLPGVRAQAGPEEEREPFAELFADTGLSGSGLREAHEAWRAEPERVAACVAAWWPRHRRDPRATAGLLVRMIRDGDHPSGPANGPQRSEDKRLRNAKAFVEKLGREYPNENELAEAIAAEYNLPEEVARELATGKAET